jgi:hypothetical protein
MAPAPDLAALMHRAQCACDALATVRDEIAITRAETQRLIAIARQASLATSWIVPDETVALIVEEPPTDEDPHVLAMEVLRMMRELLNGFPVEWQLKIIKALTARTMLVVATQIHKPLLASAA